MSKIATNTFDVPNSRLVELYNELADRPIKKFSDSDAAQRRTQRIIDESGMVLVKAKYGKKWWLEVKSEYETSINTPKNTNFQKGKSTYNADARIDVNVGHNPKRPGTLSHARFQILIDSPGLTVQTYRDRTEKLEKGHGARKALADLKWDENHEYITVWTDELLASGDFDLEGFSEEVQERVKALRGEE